MVKKIFLWLCLFVFISGAAACTVNSNPAVTIPSQTTTPGPALIQVPTHLIPQLPTAGGSSSQDPSSTAITQASFILPAFQVSGLGQNIQPQNYVTDTCSYLYQRWGQPQNSDPGTVVVPIMFHSISDRKTTLAAGTTITTDYFQRFMAHAHQLGFETITTAQLAGFLENNAHIPHRSMILIVDDQKTAQYFTTFFEPYKKKYGWTVTNAWISQPKTPASLWNQNAALAASGLVDYQAHGVIHNIPMDKDASLAYIKNEIYGPLTAMPEHFGSTPIAFIWPQGIFTPQAVEVARQAGYQLGFSASPPGPLMFNWIPLGPLAQAANDPLLVMPRYWSNDAYIDFDKAVKISQEAQAFAEQNKAQETGLYAQYCAGYPEIK